MATLNINTNYTAQDDESIWDQISWDGDDVIVPSDEWVVSKAGDDVIVTAPDGSTLHCYIED